MTAATAGVECVYCQSEHDARYLCDPVERLLAALRRRGMDLTLPDLVFPEPIPMGEIGKQLGLEPGDALLRQVTISAIVVPSSAGDVQYPGVLFSGQNSDGAPLPRWLYVGDAHELDEVRKLLERMVALAIRTARQANRKPS